MARRKKATQINPDFIFRAERERKTSVESKASGELARKPMESIELLSLDDLKAEVQEIVAGSDDTWGTIKKVLRGRFRGSSQRAVLENWIRNTEKSTEVVDAQTNFGQKIIANKLLWKDYELQEAEKDAGIATHKAVEATQKRIRAEEEYRMKNIGQPVIDIKAEEPSEFEKQEEKDAEFLRVDARARMREKFQAVTELEELGRLRRELKREISGARYSDRKEEELRKLVDDCYEKGKKKIKAGEEDGVFKKP